MAFDRVQNGVLDGPPSRSIRGPRETTRKRCPNSPVTEIPLDSSARDESVTLLHGKNVIIKLIEDEETERLLKTDEVARFLSTPNLCWKEFRETMDSLASHVDKMQKELDSELLELLYYLRRRAFYRPGSSRSGSPPPPVKISPSVLRRQKGEVSNLLRAMEKRDIKCLELEKKLQSYNNDITVLEPVVLLRCPACGWPVLKPSRYQKRRSPTELEYLYPPSRERPSIVRGEIMGTIKCSTCDLDFDRTKALRTHLHKINDSIAKVWNQHIWLEDYVARLLRQLEWQTWIHVYVLGASGVRHEIDVLAVKKGYVMVCECKTGQVDRQNVFSFWAKVDDIRSHMSVLALVEKLPEPETREFVTKNPSVILLENLGQMKKPQIIQALTDSVLGNVG